MMWEDGAVHSYVVRYLVSSCSTGHITGQRPDDNSSDGSWAHVHDGSTCAIVAAIRDSSIGLGILPISKVINKFYQ